MEAIVLWIAHRFLPLLLVAAALFAGCSTPMMSLQSTPPKAQLFASQLGGSGPKLVGETPVSLPASNVQTGTSGPVLIEFRKPGYVTKTLVVTDLSAGDLAINMELQPTTGLDEADRLNAVIDQVFDSQRLARAGRHDDALTKLRAIEQTAPQLAATYELEGGIYYLKKKYKEALDAYRQAIKYNPKSAESIRMRNLLERALGVTQRTLASEPPPAPKGKSKP